MSTTDLQPAEDMLKEQELVIDIWGIIFRRKWIIVLGVVVCAILGALYLLQAHPKYESVAQVLVEERKPALLFTPEMADQLGTITGESKHAVILKSPAIAAAAFQTGQFAKMETFRQLRRDDSPMDVLLENLEVEPVDKDTNVFAIRYRGPNAQETQQIVTGIVEAYRAFLERVYKTEGNQTRELLQKKLDDYLARIEALEGEYKEFVQSNPLSYQQSTGTNRYEQVRAAMDLELQKVLVELTDVNAQIRSLQSALLNGGPQDYAALTLVARELFGESLNEEARRRESIERVLVPLLLERADLMQRKGPDHPDVLSIQQRIASTQEYLQQAVGGQLLSGLDVNQQPSGAASGTREFVENYLHALQFQRQQLTEQKEALEQIVSSQEKAAKNLAVLLLQDQEYKDKLQRYRVLFDSLAKQLEDAVAAQEYSGYTYQQLASPEIGEKVAPVPLLIGGLSLAVGLMCGFGLAVLVDLADKGFRDPHEVQRALQMPLIGHIPLMDVSKVQTLAGSEIAPVMCTVHRPKSPQAESYRCVRTALYFSTRGKQHQVIQVTSPEPGDGKSTLAANLAVTIAHSGKSCLLLDADFRRPTQQKVFGNLSMKAGLASVVEGTIEPDDAMQRVHEVPNLVVMPCGPRPENPSELLSSGQFANVVDLLRERFEFVIIDTPPLLAVTDPMAIAAQVDGVILTFRIDKRSRPVALRARDMLVEIGAQTIGVVVNGISGEHKGYSGYRYTYGGGYGYGYTSDKDLRGIRSYYDEDRVGHGHTANGNGNGKHVPVDVSR